MDVDCSAPLFIHPPRLLTQAAEIKKEKAMFCSLSDIKHDKPVLPLGAAGRPRSSHLSVKYLYITAGRVMNPSSARGRILLTSLLFLLHRSVVVISETPLSLPHQLNRGFKVNTSSNPPSPVSFQPILTNPAGDFSLGFMLSPPSDRLDVAVVHRPSAFPVWRASPANPAASRWLSSASLSFHGKLVLSDESGGVVWSAGSPDGDRVVLLDSSNLQILDRLGSVVWQSFDSPFDTLVQDQNFTSSDALFSADRRYSMRLGTNYIALYMIPDAAPSSRPEMYWKEKAREEKGKIEEGAGPIYIRVDNLGFLGMYQNQRRVHLMAFDTFNRGIPGFRRLTLETDGNLRAYYWNTSSWVLDHTAISDACELPAYCGAYGLCTSGKDECGCLDGNRTENGCLPAGAGNLCGGGGGDNFWELRRRGVYLSYGDLLAYEKVGSLEACELGCKRNCSCWGALYNNGTGNCYRMDFPAKTLVATADEGRVGYFKLRTAAGDGSGEGKSRGAVAALVVGGLVFGGLATFGGYRLWIHRRRSNSLLGEKLSPGPYKEFKESASFGAIELSFPSSSSRG